ncbi:glycoside hydrolase family 16 protein [Tenacibaculum sp. IB213877]|uniref:glycoside hydrolase family 16 protein n=1 Tax=Tenacibaculum sp. IB213877 TaxID=3097351 RepID=UPI002A5AF8E2|nr:glycoside hydrolase family 16 protein [Tenacibaculum sp. IB213877]MDY0779514.1 glycoside hydrolase family 16 protein [Tenacibaculum sp. IB213877]
MKKIIIIIIGFALFSCQNETKKLVFEENFDGNTLNEKHWNYDLGNGCPSICGWGNNELEYYTKENAELKNGHLVITATKNDTIYQSGKIHTQQKFEFQYGTIEVRAKLPKGNGLWPAIWMLGNDINEKGWPACGEIDIMEYVGREPHTIYTSLHTPDSHGNTINSKKTVINDIEEDFHVYKTTWTKDAIEFYIDNTKVYTFSPEEKNDQTWPYNKPFYIILNLAIGGDFGGKVTDDAIFPQEFIIDYVKVYQ